jgi:DNA replication protein DnaC
MKKRDDDSLELLLQKLRWLRLPGMAQLVGDLLDLAGKDNLTTLDVLHRLCDEERASRLERAVGRRIRDARFPELNTVDGFDFDFDPVRKKLRARYLALHDLASSTRASIRSSSACREGARPFSPAPWATEPVRARAACS